MTGLAARLADHWFAFPRYSPGDRSAVIGLIDAPGSIVWGALYEILEEDIPILIDHFLKGLQLVHDQWLAVLTNKFRATEVCGS